MNYSDLIKFFGSVANAADALEVTPPCIYYWRDHGIPAGRQALIQIQTRGKLKAKPEFKIITRES